MNDDIVICEPLRTPVGSFGGQFKDIPAEDLATTVVAELLNRTGLEPTTVGDVIFGQCYPQMEAPAIGRVVALNAGMPVEVPGRQVDRRCGSGLQAVLDAASTITFGGADVVIAGGVESMSRAPFYNENIRWGVHGKPLELKDSLARGRQTVGGKFHNVAGGMIETAENIRQRYQISREDQDKLAVESHRRAAAAVENGHFENEIVPVNIPASKKVPAHTINSDAHIRPDAALQSLAKLTPVMHSHDSEATVTAGNASGQNDGAAACIVTTRSKAEELGLEAFARIAGWGLAGVDPRMMGMGPVPATNKALEKAGLTLADIDLIELNEAFAAQVLGCTREWGLGTNDFDRINVNGSGISLGHPVGATGARILATMLHELDRREARYALETMCIGGGQGIAAVFERVES